MLAPQHANRRAAWVIFILSFAAYIFFFQGLGWNQMSHFATIRSLAEHGSANIARFKDLTTDVIVTPRGVYSNKPPGIALLGTAPYFVIAGIERLLHLDLSARRVWVTNLHILTALLSSAPAAVLNALVFVAFRRAEVNLRTSMLLAGSFAFGSLSWPYSGLLMSHMMCAMLVFGAWFLLSGSILSTRNSAIAGALLGLAALCDFLVAPLTVVFAIYLIARRSSLRHWILYGSGSVAALIVLLIYDGFALGAATMSGPFHQTETFTAQGLILGQFAPPEWMRLYWITFQNMRGIFICCPMFMLCLISPMLARKPVRFGADEIVVLSILLIYLAFYLTFYGWTGGWGVGLRYMIPGMALFWLYAPRTCRRVPLISAALVAISIVNMLCICAVQVISSAPNTGPPTNADPVGMSHQSIIQGNLNRSDEMYNLASLMGVRGVWQLLPIVILLIVYFAYALARSPTCEAAAQTEGNESHANT